MTLPALALAVTTSPRRGFDRLATICCRLLGDVFDPYRPELHYMRGPGPKWHARQRSRAGPAARPRQPTRCGRLEMAEPGRAGPVNPACTTLNADLG